MPTLRNATTKSGCFVRWKPHPDHGRPSTYQITNRALRLLQSMGYTVPNKGDEVEIPHDLCRPLRILGDLHFENEESPGNVELDQEPSISNRSEGDLSARAEAQLREYIETHPRLTEEKESELSEDLNHLNSDIDVQLDANSQTDNKTGDSPAGKVDIDPDDFFGNNSRIAPDIKDIIQGKEPVNVGEDVPEDIVEVMGQIDRDEYYESLTEVSGFRDSLREFDAHPREIKTIKPQNGLLSYYIGAIEHPDKGQWLIEILDSRRGDDAPDLQFLAWAIISGPEETLFKHKVQIDDGQFVHWSVSTDGENITEGIIETEEVSGAEFHQILRDRNWLLQIIEEFVNELENARIKNPAEWKRLD